MSNSADWKRVDELFEAALERPESDRIPWLLKEEDPESETCKKVLALLELSGQESPVDKPLKFDPRGLDRALLENRMPKRINSYKVIEMIGQGGMGVVYKAVREDVGKTVALKVLSRSSAGKDQVERFLREREVLSRLEHPHIAQLFDAGFTDEGLPFFAMELVEGEPITIYSDRNRLDMKARLKLFQDLCGAVDYAHRNFIVHRDIKPSNILVTKDGIAKLLDFGIAKLLDADLDSLFETRTGARPMTLSYAAPEQIKGGDITVATDVYGLGMVAYELISGANPFAKESTSVFEVETAIINEDPAKPSQRSKGQLSSKDDLDAIIMKAIRKEPESRYPSPLELRKDIERLLENRPVLARKGSTVYTVSKFARRNRSSLVLGIALLFISTLVGLSYKNSVEQERSRTLDQSEKANSLVGMVQELISLSDPTSVSTDISGVSTEAFLQQGEQKLREDLQSRPELLPEILGILADAHLNSGNLTKAEALFKEEASLLRLSLPESRTLLIDNLSRTGMMYLINGQYQESEDIYLTALSLSDLEWSDDALEKAAVIDDLAAPVLLDGRMDEAEELANLALEMRIRLKGREHESVAKSLDDLAYIARRKGDHGQAEEKYLQAISIRTERLGAEDLETDESKLNLAKFYSDQERFTDAEPLAMESVALRKKLFDPTHPQIIDALTVLGTLYERQEKLDDAKTILGDNLSLLRERLGAKHPRTGDQLNRLGLVLWKLKEHDAAASHFDESAEVFEELYGRDHPEYAVAIMHRALVYKSEKQYNSASENFGLALQIFENNYESNHPRIEQVLLEHGRSLVHEKRNEEAKQLFQRGLDIRSRNYGSESRSALEFLFELSKTQMEIGEFEDAKIGAMKTLRVYKKEWGEKHPRTIQVQELLDQLEAKSEA